MVEPEKIKTLKAGTVVSAKNGLYRELKEVGYLLVDDYEIEKPKIVTVRKFKTEDHEKEAKDIIRKKLGRDIEEE